MGHIYVDIKITNRDDLTRLDDKHINSNQVHVLELKDVLVDTGASVMCLPSKMIKQLGLTNFKEEVVAIATGTLNVRTYDGVRIEINGTSTLSEVMELPDDSEPLLGAIPMQLLGLRLDMTTETVQFVKNTRYRI